MSIFNKTVNSIGTGINAAVGDVVTDPSVKNVAGLVRDIAIETLPGDQRTNLDVNFGEGNVKLAESMHNRGLYQTGVHRHTQKQLGNLRETAAEKGLGAGFRKAGSVFGKRIPAMLSRTSAGIAGSGGALTIPMGIWAAGDVLDTAAEAITGRNLIDHSNNPVAISTKDRRRHRHGGI